MIRDFDNPVLRDRRAADVATGVSQELCLRDKTGNMNIPPSLVLALQNELQGAVVQVGLNHGRSQGSSEIGNQRKPPHVHQSRFIELFDVCPALIGIPQTACRDKRVKMRMEVQTPSKGVRYDHHNTLNTVFEPQILIYHRSRKRRKVVQQVTVAAKDGPKNIRHRKVNPNIRNVRQGSPLIPLPKNRCSMPATGACPRLAGVRDDFLLCLGRIHLRAQASAAAQDHLLKIVTCCRTQIVVIPAFSAGI